MPDGDYPQTFLSWFLDSTLQEASDANSPQKEPFLLQMRKAWTHFVFLSYITCYKGLCWQRSGKEILEAFERAVI